MATRYDFSEAPDCEPRFTKRVLAELQSYCGRRCAVHITGRGVLTIDASMSHQDHVWAYALAKHLSIIQPVLFHARNRGSIWLWNAKALTLEA